MGVTVRSISRYRLSDGSDSSSRSDATIEDPSSIVSLVQGGLLAPGLYVGIAQRETGLASNENDTDFDAQDNVVRHTYGIFQLDNESDLDLATTCANARDTFEGYANQLMSAAGLTTPTKDLYGYICWAHNAGIGEPLASIAKYGLDWSAIWTRRQNAYMTGKLRPYAEAVMVMVDNFPADDGGYSSGGDSGSDGSNGLGIIVLLAGLAVAVMMA